MNAFCTYHLLSSGSTHGEPRENGIDLIFPHRGGKLFSFGDDITGT